VCAIPTNSLNRTFASFSRSVNKDRYLESVTARFLLLPSYRRFPNEAEFRRELMTRDLYSFRSGSYFLRRLENHGRKEQVSVGEYTIEHIMPQNVNLSGAWQAALGDDWERVREELLHTLGNLTLTGYNSEYSDRPFREKRDMKGGFGESPLRLNQGLGGLDDWNESAIRERAGRLARTASDVWRTPILSPQVLDTYRKPREPRPPYTLAVHQHLAEASPTRGLFDALRKRILALDPVVGEEILKYYIAYKAETNFVDIVPQAKRLVLALNMEFGEVYDPRGICKDVTGLGHWGNGSVEVHVYDLDELPYVIGLARQAFEKQMGNGGDGG